MLDLSTRYPYKSCLMKNKFLIHSVLIVTLFAPVMLLAKKATKPAKKTEQQLINPAATKVSGTAGVRGLKLKKSKKRWINKNSSS